MQTDEKALEDVKSQLTAPAKGPGRVKAYRCDRCGKRAGRGVYTGVNGFVHTCPACVVEIALGAGARLGKDPSRNVAEAQHYILTHQNRQVRQ